MPIKHTYIETYVNEITITATYNSFLILQNIIPDSTYTDQQHYARHTHTSLTFNICVAKQLYCNHTHLKQIRQKSQHPTHPLHYFARHATSKQRNTINNYKTSKYTFAHQHHICTHQHTSTSQLHTQTKHNTHTHYRSR